MLSHSVCVAWALTTLLHLGVTPSSMAFLGRKAVPWLVDAWVALTTRRESAVGGEARTARLRSSPLGRAASWSWRDQREAGTRRSA
jgi:hypothetical protein